MEKQRLREIQETTYGTLQRNQIIRNMAKEGKNYAEIGRMFKLTRQRVWDICNKVDDDGGKT